MEFDCPNCGDTLRGDDSKEGVQLECENCKKRYKQTRTKTQNAEKPMGRLSTKHLVDPKEKTAFALLAVFSILPWVFLFLCTLLTFGMILVIFGLVIFVRWLVELFVAAYIKTNAVEVTADQLSEIYGPAKLLADRLGKPLPSIYVLQDSVWNAFAMKLGGKRVVVLLSGAVDSVLRHGSSDQLAWLVGHELGHHYAGHLNFWRSMTARLGSWFFWVGLWYSRRCEFTCDRYGLVCANSLKESQRAICNMAVGAELAGQVNIDEAVAQWERHRSEFFVRYRTLYSTHPHTLSRLDEIGRSAEDLGLAL